jgi:hypothetical protein
LHCTAQGHEQNECSESPDGERMCKKKRMWFDGLPNRTVVTVPGFGRPRCPAPPPSASKACGPYRQRHSHVQPFQAADRHVIMQQPARNMISYYMYHIYLDIYYGT